MKNHKFIASILLASIFLAPVLSVAENGDLKSSIEDFVKNSAITTEIKARLMEAEDIDSLFIRVDTDNNGAVVLTGTVKTEAEKDRALNIAHSVDGVKEVLNKLEVQPDSKIHPDSEIYPNR